VDFAFRGELVQKETIDPPFIISFWNGPTKEETTLARYQEIADCGFNVALPGIAGNEPNFAEGLGDAHNRKVLDLCEQVGLKAVIWAGMPHGDWSAPSGEEVARMEKFLDERIARFSSHPALLGFFVHDEPGVEMFSRLAVENQYLLKKDPSHLPYINLLPNYANHPDWKGAAYEQSVAKYLDVVKPIWLSWDHYMQMFEENGNETFYWENLEIMRRQSLRTKIPFNQIIVSMKHFGYRECSEADLRWQVYTSLAYGSRGIQYYTYWYVPELAWAEAPAMITKEGKRDVKWTYVQKINHRIAKLGSTLMKLTSTGVHCTDPIPIGAHGLTADAPVKNAAGGAMVIGSFADAGGRIYVMPVNRSFKDKIAARLTLHGKFMKAAEVSQDTGKLQPLTQLKDCVLDVPLEAGEGRLFLLSDR
jgi:hypothetical protein